jgi:hypothetical protein
MVRLIVVCRRVNLLMTPQRPEKMSQNQLFGNTLLEGRLHGYSEAGCMGSKHWNGYVTIRNNILAKPYITTEHSKNVNLS